MHPTEMVTYISKNTCTEMVIEALSGNSQKLKQSKSKCPSTEDWIKYSILMQWNTMRQ